VTQSQPLTSATATTTTTAGAVTTFGFTSSTAPLAATTASTTASAPATTTVSSVKTVTFSLPTATTTTLATSLSGAKPAQAAGQHMTFRQLEDHINLWLNELNILESEFHQQAQTINSWDSLLINNAMKITQINETLEKLKLDHNRIDNQLDFIISQQNEFEQLLEPLEKIKLESDKGDLGTSEREMTYNMMETVYNDLQGIGTDLQSFIRQLNEAKSNQDTRDPLASISKILNSHINALQYLENQINNLKASCALISK